LIFTGNQAEVSLCMTLIVPLKEICRASIINEGESTVTGGVGGCLIKGRKNEARICTFDSMIEQCMKKKKIYSSHMHVLTGDKKIFKNLN